MQHKAEQWPGINHHVMGYCADRTSALYLHRCQRSASAHKPGEGNEQRCARHLPLFPASPVPYDVTRILEYHQNASFHRRHVGFQSNAESADVGPASGVGPGRRRRAGRGVMHTQLHISDMTHALL